MASKIKVDTIENVAGSGNVSLGSGHNLVVPGNQTVGGTFGVTGVTTLTGNVTTNGQLGLNTAGTGVSGQFGTGITVRRAVPEVHLQRDDGAGTGGVLMDNASSTRRMYVGTYDTNSETHIGTNGTQRLVVDASGGITMPNQPAFVAYKVGNQSVSGSTVQVTGFTTILDVGSNWDNSQNRYTVPTAGVYLAGGFWQASGTTGLHFGILKNGAAYGNDSFLDVVDASANGYSVPFSMAANDYFTWIAYNSVTKNINANRSKIWVIKVA